MGDITREEGRPEKDKHEITRYIRARPLSETADRPIEEKLRDAVGKGIKEAIGKRKLTDEEKDAAVRFSINSVSGMIRRFARAEILKKEHPDFIGREGTAEEKNIHDKLMNSLPGAAKGLKSELGEEFTGLALIGSHEKGYAGKKAYSGIMSDVDLHLVVRHGTNKAEKAADRARIFINNEAESGVEISVHSLEDAMASIRKANTLPLIMNAADEVFQFFSGRVFGDNDRIEAARKEIVQELGKNPYGEAIWGRVRVFHHEHYIQLVLNPLLIPDKLRVGREDYEEIVEARKEFNLPTFEEIKKRYGVT